MSTDARIVVFGATGYTGQLTVAALMAMHATNVVLAGRDADKLAVLARSFGGLDVAQADADSAALAAILRPGDILVSTVGPFARLGEAAATAAISSGAAYLDCSGEGAFHRTVFDVHGPSAAEAGVPLLTGFGADWVPGNFIAATALELVERGAARAADVEYLVTGESFEFSDGSIRTGEAMMASPQQPLALRDGQIREVARTTRVLTSGDQRTQAGLTTSTEPFTLPRLEPALREVSVYLGMPPARPTTAGGGPKVAGRAQNTQIVTATILDESGAPLAGARLTTINGYDYTAAALAWGACQVRAGAVDATGALGPVDAFGLPALQTFHDSLGAQVVSWRGREPRNNTHQPPHVTDQEVNA